MPLSTAVIIVITLQAIIMTREHDAGLILNFNPPFFISVIISISASAATARALQKTENSPPKKGAVQKPDN